MSFYMIIESKVKDAAKYEEYIARVPPIVAKHGGRYLVRGGPVTPLLGGWEPQRVILLEFPEEASIRRWLASPEYQAIAPLRKAGAEIRAILVHGYAEQEE